MVYAWYQLRLEVDGASGLGLDIRKLVGVAA